MTGRNKKLNGNGKSKKWMVVVKSKKRKNGIGKLKEWIVMVK